MTAQHSIIMLDVDGVLNAINPCDPEIKYEMFFAEDSGIKYNIAYDQYVIDTVRKWSQMENVTIGWLSTWSPNIEALAPFDLELINFATAEDLKKDGVLFWWKTAVVKRVMDENAGARFMWIDDDINWDRSGGRELARNTPGLSYVCPESYSGLTHENLDTIEQWILSA